jgi:hypothetical protein
VRRFNVSTKKTKQMRKNPSPQQQQRLLRKNAGVCCVCKQRGLAINFHHIDGDNSRTVDENLAVLCVKDHDAHHRPCAYSESNHLELGANRIQEYKESWEAFVTEASRPHPKILAVVNLYGAESEIHSMRLIFQWQSEKIEFERVYHLLTSGPPNKWIERAISEVLWLGKGIKIVTVDKPLEVQYCPVCSSSLSNTIDESYAKRLTDESWSTNSLCSIYVNPDQPSLAILIALKDEILYQGHLHRCGNYLHYACDKYDERIPIAKKPSVRTQATRVVGRIVDEWQPRETLIGTGNHNMPSLISDLKLPHCWERPKNNGKCA